MILISDNIRRHNGNLKKFRCIGVRDERDERDERDVRNERDEWILFNLFNF